MKKVIIMLLAALAVVSLCVSCSDTGKSEAEYYASLSGTEWISGNNKIVFDKDSLHLDIYSKSSGSESYTKKEVSYKVSINGSVIKITDNGMTDSYTYTISSDKLDLKLSGTKQNGDDLTGTWTKSNS